jgi:hypothetical protein
MIDPLGLRVADGDGARRLLLIGRSWKKRAVLPVSAMTLLAVLVRGVDVMSPTESLVLS